MKPLPLVHQGHCQAREQSFAIAEHAINQQF
jgi:hypothetical protein